MLFYLLLSTGLFGFVVFKLIQEKRQKDKPILFGTMVYTFVCSAAALLIDLLMPQPDKYLFLMIALMMGGMIIMLAVNNLVSVFQCSESVKGKYCGYHSYSSSKCPVFEYTYGGRTYHEQSTQSASHKMLERRMVEGQQYTVYVNPKYPNVFVLKKKIQFKDVMLFLFGVLCLMTGGMALAA